MIKGIGTDIIEIGRIKAAIEKNQKFVDRTYTTKEQDFLGRKKNFESHAGNFAAKEAIVKALGTGLRKLNFVDIEVLRDDLGKPYVELNDKILGVMKQMGITQIEVTLSHCKEYAVAFAIAY